MRNQLRVALLGSLFLATLSLTARPAAATAISARAEGQVLSDAQVDAQGPVGSGSLLARVQFPGAFQLDFADSAFAQAAMNDSGVGAVVAEGVFPGTGSDFLRGRAVWSETVTNNNDVEYEYIYHFFITPPRLTLADGKPGEGGPSSAQAEYEIVVELNGIPLFRSHALLSGSWAGHTLQETGTDLGGTFFADPGNGLFGYAFSSFEGTLSLGSFPPGRGFTIESRLIAAVSGGGGLRGGRAEIGDPLDLGGQPGVRGNFILSVPIAVQPQTWSGLKSLYRD